MISLVTGVGGFVGPYLAAHLNSAGHKVFGIERHPRQVPGCEIIKCDVTDLADLDSGVRDVRPDFVFHLAAVSSVSATAQDPDSANRVNVGGTKNLLSSVQRHSPKAYVLVVSTAHVYGIPVRLPISESHPAKPVSAYGRSRLGQEEVAAYFARAGLRVIISRSFNHTGPGQPPGFVCSDFARQVAAIEKGAEPVMKVGDLSSRRDFTDVRDVVQAYLLALQKCSPGIYNVCSGKAYSGREILDIFLQMSGRKIRVAESRPEREGDIPALVGDNSKFVAATGWSPSIPFRQTLSEVLDYWRGRGS